MFNNRAYYNDWEHQIRMARLRGTDEAKAHLGMDLFGPEPNFAGLARAMGGWGEGPDRPPGGRAARTSARRRGSQEGPGGAGGHDHAAPLKRRSGIGQVIHVHR